MVARWRNRQTADDCNSGAQHGSGRKSALEISYEVELPDLLWMYLGSWAARISAAPGLFCVFVVLAAWPPPADVPLASYVGMLGASLVFTALGPALLLYFLFGQYRARRLVGTTVHLLLDDRGVEGWPIGAGINRTWPRIRRARKLRGVTTLPFREFGTRAGWVPIPDRAMNPEQLSAFECLLHSKGVMKRRKVTRQGSI
jgi:hypothetical protein